MAIAKWQLQSLATRVRDEVTAWKSRQGFKKSEWTAQVQAEIGVLRRELNGAPDKSDNALRGDAERRVMARQVAATRMHDRATRAFETEARDSIARTKSAARRLRYEVAVPERQKLEMPTSWPMFETMLRIQRLLEVQDAHRRIERLDQPAEVFATLREAERFGDAATALAAEEHLDRLLARPVTDVGEIGVRRVLQQQVDEHRNTRIDAETRDEIAAAEAILAEVAPQMRAAVMLQEAVDYAQQVTVETA